MRRLRICGPDVRPVALMALGTVGSGRGLTKTAGGGGIGDAERATVNGAARIDIRHEPPL